MGNKVESFLQAKISGYMVYTLGMRYSPGIPTSAVAWEKLLRKRQRSSRRNDLGVEGKRRERERER